MSQEFVSEPILPVAGTFDVRGLARGEAGLPGRFAWRGQEYAVGHLLRTWKTSARSEGELYLRRHWFAIVTTTGEHMTLYCDRQSKNPQKPKARWWLFTVG